MNIKTNSLTIQNSASSNDPKLMIRCVDISELFCFCAQRQIKFLTNEVFQENMYSLTVTEQNLMNMFDFTQQSSSPSYIEPAVQQYIDTIQSWEFSQVQQQFLLNSRASYYEMLVQDIGLENLSNLTLLQDRSIRYQYITEFEQTSNDLANQIAFRTNGVKWIDSEAYSAEQLIKALVTLKRFPLLVIFDGHSSNNFAASLKQLTSVLVSHDIKDIGVYFRLPNESTQQQFNEFIAQNRYNQKLNNNTQVAIIRNGALPKCLFTAQWIPKSVLYLHHGPINNKTNTYVTSICDLILLYTKNKPILSKPYDQISHSRRS